MKMRLKIKKTACLLLCLAMLLVMFAGCSGGGGDVTTTPSQESTGSTEPDTSPTDGTEPDVTEPDVTDPTEAAPSEDDVTEPTDPVVTEPAVTEPDTTVDPTEDPQPTEPVAPADPTDPADPQPTEPAPEADPSPTEPDPTPSHTHSYTKTVVKPTCTDKGYTLHKCSCGDSYKDTYTKAAGHSYSTSTVKATCKDKGYTLHKCGRCGDSYKDNYTAAGKHSYKVTATKAATFWVQGNTTYTCAGCGDSYKDYFTISAEDKEQFVRDVEAAFVKYLNQFRKDQGDTKATVLPGLTQVAQYRAVQLQTNFEHSIADLREAYAHYQYGEWVDATEYGEDASKSYYTANAKEAIGRGDWSMMTADEIGCALANGFRNSSGHWAYLGSSKYPYIGVGISYKAGMWYCCTLQTTTNYG